MAVVAVIGLEEVTKKLREAGIAITAIGIDNGLKAAAALLRAEIKARAPRAQVQPKWRKYGPIVNCIFSKKDVKKGGYATAIEDQTYNVGVTNHAFYAWFIEHGYTVGGKVRRSRAGGKSKTTHTGEGQTHYPAQPFVRPAFDELEPEMNALIEAGIRDVVRQYE